jgi:Flp pilus assembly protein TadG
MRRRRGERGVVTAELALALPLLVALCVGLVWVLSLATAQTRVVDASREAARALARGDAPGVARDLAGRIAPPGAVVTVAGDDDRVEVRTSVVVHGPGGLFAVLPGVPVSALAVAVREAR